MTATEFYRVPPNMLILRGHKVDDFITHPLVIKHLWVTRLVCH